MVPVVTYCRVSSDEQAEKDISIPAQRKAIRGWAEGEGQRIVHEFLDEGQSAYAPAEKRPGFRDMIAFCRKQDVQFILVHKLDRFSRNREESILFKSLLRKNGVMVKSITEHFDPDTPQGFLYEGMIEVINQFYSMNLATETLKGMKENAERGYHNGGRIPYGYRLETFEDGGRERRRLILGPEEETSVIKEIFRLATEEQMGAKRIANELNKRGLRAPRSKHWSGSTLSNMLNNPVYVGDLVWRRRKTVDRDKRRIAPREDWIVTPNAHAAIIDREAFDSRKRRAKKRSFHKQSAPQGHAKFLLSRLIKCQHCGGNFVGRHQKYKSRKGHTNHRRSYYCNSYLTKGNSVCRSLPVREAWADGIVTKLIRARLVEPEALAELERRIKERIGARSKALGADPAFYARKLEELDRRIENYYTAIGEGLDPLVCRKHIDDLKAKRAEVAKEASVVEEADVHNKALQRTVDELRRFASAFKDGFEELPLGVRRRIVQHFVERIDIADRKVFRVHLRVPIDPGGLKILSETVDGDVKAGQDSKGLSVVSACGENSFRTAPNGEP